MPYAYKINLLDRDLLLHHRKINLTLMLKCAILYIVLDTDSTSAHTNLSYTVIQVPIAKRTPLSYLHYIRIQFSNAALPNNRQFLGSTTICTLFSTERMLI